MLRFGPTVGLLNLLADVVAEELELALRRVSEERQRTGRAAAATIGRTVGP